ncbi:MAG: SRPBCC family protein [Saprospiraceae bacterium]
MKLKYKFEMEIKKPLEEVIRLFANRDNLSKWQKGLLSSEFIADPNGRQRYLLMYKLGRRKMKMTETILKNELPAHYDVNFKLKGAQHTTHNSFYSSGYDSTKWVSEVEYNFSGFMKILARFIKSGFEQQSLMYMKSFKAFAEKHGRP